MSFFKKIFGKNENKENIISENKRISNAETLKFDAVRALKAGDYAFAIKALQHALNLNPTFEIRFYFTEALISLQSYTEALDQLNTLIEEEPENPLLYIMRGNIIIATHGDDKLLNEDASKLLQIIDKNEDYDLYLKSLSIKSIALIHLENYLEALQFIDIILGEDAENEQAYLLKTKAYKELKNWNEMQKVLDTACLKFPENEYFVIHQAELFTALNNFQKAIESYQLALEINPFSSEAQVGIASIYQKENKLQLAINVINNAIDESGRQIVLLKKLKELYLLAQENEKAQALEEEISNTENTIEEKVNFNQLYRGQLF